MAAAVTAGVDWLQVRDRSLGGTALSALVDAVGAEARSAGARSGRSVRVLVNRRIDVALASGADGVHLGFDALQPAEARRLLGAGALVGISCHAPAEVRAAKEANYAHLAPVFEPLSKAATRPPLGTAAIRSASGLPVLAQGGIGPANVAACMAAGAAGVAVTGAILAAPNPGRASAALRAALDGSAEPT
ncbi:MAG: thiamine phosphate synthase [Myxococcota bacterium]|nr:thiamine phosphate synthase [Myxococcota bacterium]MDP6244054.1 thiamine phosphate synthase [Myxococcota bacterium]MDP7074653.1 thiamine phosphate synthase [Myxococcota bacterium]MDP7299514.1 thiamine phosphate synthase [Myxococcota bacterium]MDP7432138.1 thiamine phosphate synthase [Myxococcota bacterium]